MNSSRLHPPNVKIARPLRHTVTLYIEENGQTEAVERAEVRARIRGFLEEIKFNAGETVKEKEMLYLIEPQQYKANLDAQIADLAIANAAVARSRADIEKTESDYQRHKKLFEDDATSQSRLEEAKAARDGAKAQLAGSIANKERAKADVQLARIDFGYTKVRAPITGAITRTEVKVGNLVENGTHLATIVKHDPIYAIFNINERFVQDLQEMYGEGERAGKRDLSKIPAELQLREGQNFPFKGRLNYVDQEVDQGTGTLMIRAIFPNPGTRILPGNHVRVRVPFDKLENAILIPESATAADQQGRYTYVVIDKKVVRRDIKVGSKYQGMIVVEEGLQPDDMVIVSGIQRSRPGLEVDPETVTLSFDGQQDQDIPATDTPPVDPDANPQAGDAVDASVGDTQLPKAQ